MVNFLLVPFLFFFEKRRILYAYIYKKKEGIKNQLLDRHKHTFLWSFLIHMTETLLVQQVHFFLDRKHALLEHQFLYFCTSGKTSTLIFSNSVRCWLIYRVESIFFSICRCINFVSSPFIFLFFISLRKEKKC